jgi:nitroreductase
MELLAAIESRSSAARLGLPAPTPEHLARILDAAAHAPDHGRLRPWRFIVVDAGLRDGFALAAASAKRVILPSMSEEQFAAECEKMKNSPTIVVVGCTVRREHKVPEIEQVIAAAAAAENLFLAAHDLGYGVMWKTGAAAYDAGVKAAIGLSAEDHIVGIMHLGTRLK